MKRIRTDAMPSDKTTIEILKAVHKMRKEAEKLRIPEIVTHYDALTTSKNRRGQDVILYSKTYDNGVTIYVEEVRSGRKELAIDTMYIHKK